jgi:hypothetical protein
MAGGISPRRAGDRFERDVVRFLVANGYPYAERSYGAGRPDDRGDIDGLPGWIIQCRANRELDVGGALASAERQTPDRFHFAAAICKRRNHGTADAYVVMSLATFAAIAGDRQHGHVFPAQAQP